MNYYFNIISPLNQFEVRDLISLNPPILGNLSLSLTNIGLYLTLGGYLVFILSLVATNNQKMVSNYWSICQESVYVTVHSIVVNQINEKRGQAYLFIIYALFIFILVNNLIGMVPYTFACTNHFILAFSLSFTVVLGATILGLNRHGLKFFSLFVPAGCPLGLLPLLVLIEFIYLAKNVLLGFRLAVNIFKLYIYFFKFLYNNVLFFPVLAYIEFFFYV